MQASKTATEGSNAMALSEVLSVLGECLHGRLLGVDPHLECEHVRQLGAAVFADKPERQIANVHAMDDKRARDAQDSRCVIRAEFLVLGEHCNAAALNEMTESGLKQGRGLRRQLHDLVVARFAADANLDVITLAKLAERPGLFPILLREFDELQHVCRHVPVSFQDATY